MADYGGGRVVIDVVGDTSDFTRDLQAKVDAAVAGVHANVRVDDHDKVGVKADFEPGTESKLRAQLEAAEARLSEHSKVKVKVDVDESSADEAKNGFERLVGAVDRTGGAFTGLAGAGLPGIALLGGLTGAIGPLIGALAGLVAGLAPAIGALAALPAALVTGGSVLATFKLGLGDAVKGAGALEKQSQQTGAAVQSSANAQRAAAQAVVSANQSVQAANQRLRDTTITNAEQIKASKQSLASAEQQQALNQVAAIKNVQAAEYAYAQTLRTVQQAVKSLQDARANAARSLEDQANAAKDAELSAQSAQLALQNAQINAANVAGNPNSTALQLAEANLGVQQAQQQLTEANLSAQRAATDNTKAQKAGVDGNTAVVSATQQLKDAQHEQRVQEQGLADLRASNARQAVADTRSIQDAQQRLGDTYRTTSEASASAVQQVANSQQALANAIRSQQQASSAGAGAQADALKGLDAKQREFAKTLVAFEDGPLKRLKTTAADALLPGLSQSLQTLGAKGGLFDALGSVVSSTGGALGRFAAQGATMLSSGPFSRDLVTIGKGNVGIIDSVGAGIRSVLNSTRTLAVAGQPLVQFFADTFRDGAKHVDAFLQKARATGQLTTFFDTVKHSLTDLGHILRDVAVGIGHFFGAGIPTGTGLLDSLAKAAAQFRAFTGSADGQSKFRKFFEDTAPAARALGDIFNTLVGAFAKVSAGNAGAFTTILTNLAAAAPALSKAITGFGSGFGGGLSAISGLLGLLGKASASGGILGSLAGGVAQFAGAAAGLAVVGKQSGLFALIGGLGKMISVVRELGGLEGIINTVKVNFAALNLIIDANPIVAIGIAVVAAGIAFYELYKHSKTFRDIIDSIGSFLKTVFLGALHGVQAALGFISDHFKLIATILSVVLLGPLGVVIAAFLNFGKIKDIISDVVGAVVDFFSGLAVKLGHIVVAAVTAVVGFFATLPGKVITAVLSLDAKIVQFFVGVFSSLGKALLRGIATTVQFFIDLPGKVIGAIASLDRKLLDFGGQVLRSLLSGLGSAVSGVLSFFSGLPGRMVSAIGNIGKTMANIGINIVDGIINGIGGAGSRFATFVTKWVEDHIPGPIKKLLDMFSPSRVMAGIGVNVVAGLAQGIDAHGPVAEASSRRVAQKVATAAQNVAKLHYAVTSDIAVGGGQTSRSPVGGAFGRTSLDALQSRAKAASLAQLKASKDVPDVVLGDGAIRVSVDGVERKTSVHTKLRRANISGDPPAAPTTVVHA